MIRFETPNGKQFDLDYVGPIHCRNDQNDLIAVCAGKYCLNFEKHVCDTECEGNGDPRDWSHWEIIGEEDTIFQRAIASAFVAVELAARIAVEKESK